MEKSYYLILNFITKKDKYTLIAIDDDQEKLFKEEANNKDDLMRILFEKARQYTFKHYVVMNEMGHIYRETEPQDLGQEHFGAVVYDDMRKLSHRNKDLEEALFDLKLYYDDKPNDVIYGRIHEILLDFFPEFGNFKLEKVKPEPWSDRDYLDVNIEIYLFLISRLHGVEYATITNRDGIILKDQFLNVLIEDKVKKYGADILRNLGLNVLDVTEKGFLIDGSTEELKGFKN